MINAKLITQPCSDLKIVNAARVSMKVSHDDFDETGDTKLINYLARHRHWTPFAHVRETILFLMPETIDYYHFIDFITINLTEEEKTGMAIQKVNIDNKLYLAVKTSVFGWSNIIPALHKSYLATNTNFIPLILSVLLTKYPVATKALVSEDFIHHYSKKTDIAESFERNKKNLSDAIHLLETKMFDVTFYQTCPIFIARQVFKTVVMMDYNEISRRYVSDEPEIYMFEKYRSMPEKSIKQGSGGVHKNSDALVKEYAKVSKTSEDFYNKLITEKVAPEMARGILPQSMMTEYYASGNLVAYERLISQRLDSHAQKEIQELAAIINSQMVNVRNSINNAKNYSNPLEYLEFNGVY